MTRIGILGAGIAGLSSAWLLSENGIDATVIEKQSYAGGLARSFQWHGFWCDFAAHRLFTNDENVLNRLLALVPMGRHIRRSRLYLAGRWLHDPLNVLELMRAMLPGGPMRILASYLVRPRNIASRSFESFVLQRYGRYLYHLFFKPYTEKLFGIPGNEIAVEWAQRKVRLASPFDFLRKNTKTKFQYFYYPVRGGYGAIPNTLFQRVTERILLESRVTSLNVEADRIISVSYERGGQVHTLPVDYLVSTLPFTLTAHMLGQPVSLRFRKVDAVYLWIRQPFVSDNHWMYFADADIAVNRLVEFKNMSSVDKPADTSVLCAEVTQEHPDVVEKVIGDLVRANTIRRDEILDTLVVREEFAYPVYDRNYIQVLQQARETLGRFKNLRIVGRAAEFEHREVDDNFSAASEMVNDLMREILPSPIAITRPEPTAERPAVVSAVILTLNNYSDTRECLESMRSLSRPVDHLILVDNGSTDGTPARVRAAFPEVTVIENGRNIGVPSGYNVGFKYALEHGADFVLMLNNDTVLKPNLVDELLRAGADPKVGIVMPRVLYHQHPEEVWSSGARYRRFPPAIVMRSRREPVELPRFIEYAPGCVLLIRRKAFELAGLFDPGYLFLYDDWDFSERVRAHDLLIAYAPDALAFHKVSRTTGGPQSSLFWKTYAESVARFYRRHGRPAWLSVPIHLSYVAAREFLFKGNWRFFRSFMAGVRSGISRPLGPIPSIHSFDLEAATSRGS